MKNKITNEAIWANGIDAIVQLGHWAEENRSSSFPFPLGFTTQSCASFLLLFLPFRRPPAVTVKRIISFVGREFNELKADAVTGRTISEIDEMRWFQKLISPGRFDLISIVFIQIDSSWIGLQLCFWVWSDKTICTSANRLWNWSRASCGFFSFPCFKPVLWVNYGSYWIASKRL